MGAAKRRQPLGEFAGHVRRGVGGTVGDCGKARCDGQQVFNTMAHFAGQQLMGFLGLFASGHIQENAEHDAPDNALVAALSARRDPSAILVGNDPEIYFIRPDQGARCGKSRPDAVAVGRVDMGGQIFEADGRTPWLAPHGEGAFVHRQPVGIHIPGPQRDTRRPNRKAQIGIAPGETLRLSGHFVLRRI